MGGHWEHPTGLEGKQLAGGAWGTVDLELFTGAADLLPVKLREGLTEDLGKAEPELASNTAKERKLVVLGSKDLPQHQWNAQSVSSVAMHQEVQIETQNRIYQ